MSRIRIRPACPTDLEQVSTLFIALDAYHFALRPQDFLPLDKPARSRDMIAGMMASPQGILLAADFGEGTELIGLAHVLRRDIEATFITPAKSIALVDCLVTDQRYRRKGIGSALVMAARQWAGDQGLSGVELNVRGFNRMGIAFYETLGFEVLNLRLAVPALPKTPPPCVSPPSSED